MALQIADNFTYKGRKPLDQRLVTTDIPSLVALPTSILYDGIEVYVVTEKKFYVWDNSNTVDATLQKWRELTTAGILIQNATIDSTKGSATEGHLILTLTDGSTLDCGTAIGPKGDKGDGFAIIKLYSSISDMTSDTTPVTDGQMVAVIDSSTTPLTAKVYIRNSSQTSNTATGDETGYTFFCNLADATVIQGPKGDKGLKGDKGDTPVITLTQLVATSSKPSGTKVTITTGTGATATTSTFNIYDGVDGLYVSSAYFNASNELIFKMSDNKTEYNVGTISSSTGGCITILGCFDSAPTTYNKNDYYYDNTTGLIYTATSSSSWDTGSTPIANTLYISIADNKIYSYVNNTFLPYGGSGTSDISKKKNNAISKETDGLFVEDLSNELNNISIAQKTVNTELEYYYANKTGTDFTGVSLSNTKDVINYLPYLTSITSNLDQSRYTKNGVILQKSKTYKITFELIRSTSASGVSLYIMDSDGNKLSNRGYSGSTQWDNNIVSTIYTPNKDTSVYPALDGTLGNITGTYFPDCSFFQVEEVGRQITIDPVNYIEKSSGIETVPIGTVISYTGTDTPNHYLPCDGSVYNITDYPELAEQIKGLYGSYNAFGGDGTTTFATPVKQLTNVSQSGNGLISNYQTDGTAFTNLGNYSSSEPYTNVFNYATASTWFSANSQDYVPLANKPHIGYRFNSPKFVNKVKLTNMIYGSCYRCIDFDIEGSSDGTNWDTLLSNTLPGDSNEHEFDLTTTGLYSYYRLVFTKCPSAGTNYNWGLGKLKFYGTIDSKYLIKSELTYFMRYYTGISSGEMYDEYILRTGSKETFKEFCQDIKQLENRPDLWEAGKEYDFGSGLYGLRTKGNFSNNYLQVISASAEATNIISWGGSVTNTNGNRWALPGDMSDYHYEIYRKGTSTNSPYWLQFSGSGDNPTDADIWVKYTKSS